MSKHLQRILAVAASIVITAVPAVLEDPAVKHAISTNTFLAAYFPIVSGIVYALYRAYTERPKPTQPA